ncbi:FdtA/QdtA family cupin domain-containing protein [Erysipelotrichaceae bacterium HCN-30851]
MSNLAKVKLLEFKQNGDDRGHLVVVEGNSDIPFEIKRIFYIYGSDKDVIRGQHANRKTEFVLINVSGTSKVKVTDGKIEKIYNLDHPHMGIYLPKMVWKDMYDFSDDSVLLVLASEHYEPSEYIRDFSEYVKEIQ